VTMSIHSIIEKITKNWPNICGYVESDNRIEFLKGADIALSNKLFREKTEQCRAISK